MCYRVARLDFNGLVRCGRWFDNCATSYQNIISYTGEMDTLEILAIIASLVALTAWGLNQYGKLSENSLLYDLLFLMSASVLLFYAYKTNAIPFIIVNAAWVVASFIEVVRDMVRKSHRNRLSS